MKVMLINGSPKEKGNTYLVLEEFASALKTYEIDSEIFQIGKDPISPCMGCGACAKLSKCVIDDKVNEFNRKMKDSDALVAASPVHYACATGSLLNFMARAFFSGFRSNSDVFRLKPAAAIAVARRAGTTTTLDQINKFYTISEMPIISGRYWNMVHGQTVGQVNEDLEGMQNIKILARNMAYFLKCKEIAKKEGILPPEPISNVQFTNFIR